MCELKLSLQLVVCIFVHLSSNSEMNMFMFIYNYIHLISNFNIPGYDSYLYYGTSCSPYSGLIDTLYLYCLLLSKNPWLVSLHLILTPRSLSFRTVLVVCVGGGGFVNPPTERVQYSPTIIISTNKFYTFHIRVKWLYLTSD